MKFPLQPKSLLVLDLDPLLLGFLKLLRRQGKHCFRNRGSAFASLTRQALKRWLTLLLTEPSASEVKRKAVRSSFAICFKIAWQISAYPLTQSIIGFWLSLCLLTWLCWDLSIKLAILHQSVVDRRKFLRLEHKRIRAHLKNIKLKTNIWVLKAFR